MQNCHKTIYPTSGPCQYTIDPQIPLGTPQKWPYIFNWSEEPHSLCVYTLKPIIFALFNAAKISDFGMSKALNIGNDYYKVSYKVP